MNPNLGELLEEMAGHIGVMYCCRSALDPKDRDVKQILHRQWLRRRWLNRFNNE